MKIFLFFVFFLFCILLNGFLLFFFLLRLFDVFVGCDFLNIKVIMKIGIVVIRIFIKDMYNVVKENLIILIDIWFG